MNLIFFLINIISIILCIPFLTLFERKVLSYRQNRKGPKKVRILGILQPISDGVKLIIKEFGFPKISKKIGFFLSPLFLFLLMVFSLISISNIFKGWRFMYSVLIFLVFSSIRIFSLFFSAISRKSKYTLLGAFRRAAQVISYEISVILILLIPCCLRNSLKFSFLLIKYKFIFLIFPRILFFWIIRIIAETKRAPFDFSEGERELVSGFKTEYSSLQFTFLFLGEYGNIIISSILSRIIFFKKLIFLRISSLFFIFIFVWFRRTFPRYRYDLLMKFSWKVILPSVLWIFFLIKICFSSSILEY